MRVIPLGVVLVALVLRLVTWAVGTTFGQSILIVVAGSGCSGLFVLLATWIQVRENRKIHERLDGLEKPIVDVARNTSTDRRETDPPAPADE